MNTHEQIKELIAIYDSLSRTDRQSIDQHLRSCPICQTQLAAYKKMDAGLETLLDPKPAQHMRTDFYVRLESERPNQDSFWSTFPSFFKQLSAYAAQAGALVIIAIVVFSMWLAMRSQTEQPAVAPSLPAAVPDQPATPTTTATAVPTTPDISPAPTSTPPPQPPVWNINQLTSLSGQLNVVKAISISEDGRYLAATGSNFNTIIWQQTGNSDQYQMAVQTEVAYGASLNSLTFSAQEYLAVGGADGSDGLVSVRSLANGEPAFAIPTQIPAVESIAFSNSGKVLAIGAKPIENGQNGAVYLWFLEYSDRLYDLAFEGKVISDLAFSPDDSLVAAASNSEVSLWQVTSNEFLQTLSSIDGQTPVFSSLAFASDGQMIAAGTRQGEVYIWEVSTGQLLYRIDTETRAIQNLAFSADSQQLATVSSDGQVTIWQLDSTRKERLLNSRTADWLGLATDLIFIDEGVLVAVGMANGQVQLWQAAPANN